MSAPRRSWRSLPAWLLLPLQVVACAHAPPPPDAALLVRAPPASQLFIDDAYSGLVRPVALALRSGLHRIEVRAEGHLSAYREVRLLPGQRATLEVTLRPDLDAERSP